MRNIKTLVCLSGATAAICVAGLTGCSTWGNHTSDRTEGRIIDDKKITAKVEAALTTAPVYKFNDVDVKTFNGVVQLSGFVTTDEQKRQAGEIAQRVEGVAQVINSITMKPGVSPTGQPSGDLRRDADRTYRNDPNNTYNNGVRK
jgi:hyperosmotically inducible protein